MQFSVKKKIEKSNLAFLPSAVTAMIAAIKRMEIELHVRIACASDTTR
jgi:hypothetical protein